MQRPTGVLSFGPPAGEAAPVLVVAGSDPDPDTVLSARVLEPVEVDAAGEAGQMPKSPRWRISATPRSATSSAIRPIAQRVLPCQSPASATVLTSFLQPVRVEGSGSKTLCPRAAGLRRRSPVLRGRHRTHHGLEVVGLDADRLAVAVGAELTGRDSPGGRTFYGPS